VTLYHSSLSFFTMQFLFPQMLKQQITDTGFVFYLGGHLE
jgi:hypothetical protein